MPSQHYLGLCVDAKRKDVDVDIGFEERFQSILRQRDHGAKVLYCSFGTFYEDSNPAVVHFLNSIITAVMGLPCKVEVVFSIKSQTMHTLMHHRTLPPNIHFFSKVPQLNVLANADLHITHGGLGSIKESIYYKVPMLVYPLDYNYDQNGNGLKIEHHGLGIRGIFNQDTPSVIAEKILALLNDGIFKTTVEKFNTDLHAKYPRNVITQTIENLIQRNESI